MIDQEKQRQGTGSKKGATQTGTTMAAEEERARFAGTKTQILFSFNIFLRSVMERASNPIAEHCKVSCAR